MLKEELVRLRKDIDKHLKEHPHLKEEQNTVKELPGIGDKNSLPLLAFLHQYFVKTSGQGTAKGITAFAGLDPTPCESGGSVYKRPVISRQGSPKIRKVLYLAVRGGMRSKDPNNPSDRKPGPSPEGLWTGSQKSVRHMRQFGVFDGKGGRH